jgi:hypothetical protein
VDRGSVGKVAAVVPWLAPGLAALMLSAGLVALSPSVGVAQTNATQVLVTGPPDFAPQPGYELHVAGKAYEIAENGGGVVSVASSVPFRVQLSRLGDCEVAVSFVAEPSRRYEIDYQRSGRVTWHTTAGLDGAGLLPHEPSACGFLPDTATSALPSDAPESLPPLALVGALVAATAISAGRPGSLTMRGEERPARNSVDEGTSRGKASTDESSPSW